MFDSRILNTMNQDLEISKKLLEGTGVSILDAVRFVKNVVEAKPSEFKMSNVRFCAKVVNVGLRTIRLTEMTFECGFSMYLEGKKHLRRESLRDIRCVGRRLIRFNADFARRNFSEIKTADCEQWLCAAFTTPSQFNKARTILHALFEFALRRDWCDVNPIKRIERRKIFERQIEPLSLEESRRLIKTAQSEKNPACVAAVALLLYAGIRPRELSRLRWRDIDFDENSITVSSECSKTGGVRQVDICPTLKRILSGMRYLSADEFICPNNWTFRWRKIRDRSGFRGQWVQDVLRHTYASFYAKHFADLARLQLNMGHRDVSLLRSRYVNMRGITRHAAEKFFRAN